MEARSIIVTDIKLSKEENASLKNFLEHLIDDYVSKSERIAVINVPRMEKRYYNLEEKLLMRTPIKSREIEDILPLKLITIPHEGNLRILAFSDYRVHSIDEILEFVRNLNEKPDLIVYAGDDVKRFAPPPRSAFMPEYYSRCDYPEEILNDSYHYRLPSGKTTRAREYVIRLSKKCIEYSKSSGILSRIQKMKEFFDSLDNIKRKFDWHIGSKKIHEKFLAEVKQLTNRFNFRLVVKERSRVDDFDIYILDDTTKTCIVNISVWVRPVEEKDDTIKLSIFLHSNYITLLRDLEKSSKIKILNLEFNSKKYTYHLILIDRPDVNIFEKLAKYTKYGVLAIIGNDDDIAARMYIRGEDVYELQSTLVKIGRFLFVGLEGATSDIGYVIYPESFVRFRLEFIKRFLDPNDKLVIVSHSPPRGLLDRAIRFGDRAIGSVALRDFIDEDNNVILVICGHVHREGGKYTIHDNRTAIVNVSSHDSPIDRANVAVITISNEKVQKIEFFKLPSPLELVFKNNPLDEARNFLIKTMHLSPRQADIIIEGYLRFGLDFIVNLGGLANIKYKYGFTWDHILEFYSMGVRSDDDLNEVIVRRLLEQPRCRFRQHLRRAFTKFLRIRKAKKEVFLLEPLPFSKNSKIIAFDLEYLPDRPVLYGFYDLTSEEIKQFWYDEIDKLRRYIESKKDYIFVHWGGCDKKFIREIDPEIKTVNLLYYVQIALVAPTSSSSLNSVHDALFGRINDSWWEKHFYWADGFLKLMLCNEVLRNPNNSESKDLLAGMNKADIIALAKIIRRLFDLKVRNMDTLCTKV